MHTSRVLIFLFIFSYLPFMSYAQSDDSAMVKKIEVSGSAEEEIVPDEIFFAITLKEYLDDDKKKVSIDKLERQLNDAVRKLGVAEEDFRIEDIQSYNYDWYRKKRPQREQFLASKK